jgi:hypothetical protein
MERTTTTRQTKERTGRRSGHILRRKKTPPAAELKKNSEERNGRRSGHILRRKKTPTAARLKKSWEEWN